MSTITDAGLAAGWRAQALAALGDGRAAEAHEWLRQALAETTELEWLNDLGVLAHGQGRDSQYTPSPSASRVSRARWAAAWLE